MDGGPQLSLSSKAQHQHLQTKELENPLNVFTRFRLSDGGKKQQQQQQQSQHLMGHL